MVGLKFVYLGPIQQRFPWVLGVLGCCGSVLVGRPCCLAIGLGEDEDADAQNTLSLFSEHQIHCVQQLSVHVRRH